MKQIPDIDRQIDDYKKEYNKVVSDNPKAFNAQKKANARYKKEFIEKYNESKI